MNSYIVGVIAIILTIILFILCYFLLSNIFINYDTRYLNYSITSLKTNESTFFEKLFNLFWKYVKKTSTLLNKSELFKRYGNKFNKYINYKDIHSIRGIDYISIKFIISILFGILYLISTLFSVSYNSFVLIIIMFLSFFILDIYFKIEYKSRRKSIENDLLSAIIIMNNAFKSGMNIMQAINIVENELEGPIKEEFKKINLDIKYGLSLEVVFERFYNRVKIEDIKYIASSLSLINKTGGNIVKVFGSIEKNFYDKKKINDEMNSLISSSVFMYRLLITIPIILSLLILFINPTFFLPLINTLLGKIIMLIILIFYVCYIFVIKRIMKVIV